MRSSRSPTRFLSPDPTEAAARTPWCVHARRAALPKEPQANTAHSHAPAALHPSRDAKRLEAGAEQLRRGASQLLCIARQHEAVRNAALPEVPLSIETSVLVFFFFKPSVKMLLTTEEFLNFHKSLGKALISFSGRLQWEDLPLEP